MTSGLHNPENTLGTGALDALGVAVAIAEPESLSICYENSTFSKWFPGTGEKKESLESRCATLNSKRARRRLAKGRPYSFESESGTGARSKCLKMTLSPLEIDGESFLLVEGVDATKQKEIEHMLDSYSDLAERKGRQLEAANRTITAQRDRMQRELEIARDLQLSMLPDIKPNEQQCTLYGSLTPARELGGDFFDYFFVDERRICITVGDVSDKGAASALFAAAAKTLLKAHTHRTASCAEVLSRVNNELSKNNEYCMFVTLFFGVLDLETGHFNFTNAGHEPPYVIRSDGAYELLTQRHGLPLGVDGEAGYEEDTTQLEKGDVLLIYTDGVTDAENPDREVFGRSGLEQILASQSDFQPESLGKEIAESVRQFEDGGSQRDDVTIVAVGFKCGKEA